MLKMTELEAMRSVPVDGKKERKPETRGAKKKPNTAQQNRIDVKASNVKVEMSHTSD